MRQRAVPSPPMIAIGALLAAAGLYLTWLASHLWFVLDDFAFLLHRRLTFSGDHSLLMPHNDHWVTLPIVIYRVLFHLVGMHHYLPYALVTIGLHVATALLLAVMFLRSGAEPWVCVVMTAVVAFMGAGATDILWDFQMVFVGPTALALGAMVLLDRGEQVPRFPVAVWALLAAALMFSGAGVSMVAWAAAYALVRRGWKQAFKVALPPTLLYVLWYVVFDIGTSPAPPTPPGRIIPFMLRGMTNLWDQVLPVPWLGVVVLVLITVVTVRARRRPRLRTFAAAGLLGLLFHFLLLAITRGGWGTPASTSPRYLYLGVLLTLPAVGLTLQVAWDRLVRFPLPRALVFAALGLVFVAQGARLFHQETVHQQALVDGLRERVVAAGRLVQDGVPVHLDPARTRHRPRHRHRVARTARRPFEPAAALAVATDPPRRRDPAAGRRVQDFARPAPGDRPPRPTHATRLEHGILPDLPREGRCHRAPPRLRGRAARSGSPPPRTPSRPSCSRAIGRVTACARPVPVGKPVFVGISAVGGRLLVTVPSGAVTLCSAGSVTVAG